MLRLVAVLAALALAGCFTPPAAEDAAPADAPPEAAAFAAPAVDAAEVLATVKSFSEAFPRRHSDNDMHNAARDWIAAEFEKAGLEVIRDELTADVSVGATPSGLVTGGGRLVNVCGVLWGENREELVVLGGHYDVTEVAVYGAYDDGSGTVMTIRLAQAFAEAAKERAPARTALFCMFDGEEQGLRGSAWMAQGLLEGSWHLNGTVVAMINLDMAGIAWPAPSPLVIDITAPELATLVENLTAEVGYPEGAIEYRGIRAGRSDYGSFIAIGAPTVFFISAFDDVRFGGVAYPQSYPFWHRLDTYEGMVVVADGEENLRAGFQNLLDVVSPLTARLLYDATFVPTFEEPER